MSARFEVIPSIDLRRGRVVRLREGRDDQATVYATPAELLLERFAAAGARRVHVVDLDAAFGEPPQRERLAALLRAAERQDQALRFKTRSERLEAEAETKTFQLRGGRPSDRGEGDGLAVGVTPEADRRARATSAPPAVPAPPQAAPPGRDQRGERFRLQLGGGLRDAAAVESALDAGFDRVVLGSMIVRDPETFEQLCRRHAGRIVPALDCRADEVLHDGWKSRSSLLWKSLALSFKQKSLVFPSILVTDVARDGTLAGANVELAAAVGETAGAPAIVSGGVASIEDVARAAAAAHAGCGIGGIVLGRALHEGRLTIEAALAAASFELAGSVAR